MPGVGNHEKYYNYTAYLLDIIEINKMKAEDKNCRCVSCNKNLKRRPIKI